MYLSIHVIEASNRICIVLLLIASYLLLKCSDLMHELTDLYNSSYYNYILYYLTVKTGMCTHS